MASELDESFLDRSEPDESTLLRSRFSRSDVQKIGLETARKCWDEFYIWELDWCNQQLLNLAPWTEVRGIEELPTSAKDWKSNLDIAMDVDSESAEDYSVHVYDTESRSAPLERITFEEVEVSGDFLSHPMYESCPPSSKNMLRASDHPEEIQSLFIPYADEAAFDSIKYTSTTGDHDYHWSFIYQDVWVDPDCE